MPHPPLIGITNPPPDRKVGYLKNYSDAVGKAGGVAVTLPWPFAPGQADLLVERLDGILLPGGHDVDPTYYDEAPHPQLGSIDADHDAAEIALARATLAARKPLFCICRGMQVLNVALGGSLYQDLAAQYPGALNHDQDDYLLTPHTIDVVSGSRLHAILGATSLAVNSLHHQAVCRISERLVVTARAPDGIVEAVEIPDQPFALAVQYHPEALVDGDPLALLLFTAFVQSCR
jgi:putative glutamine amidotransferase